MVGQGMYAFSNPIMADNAWGPSAEWNVTTTTTTTNTNNNDSFISGPGIRAAVNHTGVLTPASQDLTGFVWHFAAAFGALVAFVAADRFGRQPAIALATVKVLLGSVIIATTVILATASATLPGEPSVQGGLGAGRIFAGLGAGELSVLVPVYIAEIAPAAHRGELTLYFQYGLLLGALLQTGKHAVIFGDLPEAATLLYGFISGSVLLAGSCFLPASPSHLLLAGRERQARRSLKVFRETTYDAVTREFHRISRCVEEQKQLPRASCFCRAPGLCRAVASGGWFMFAAALPFFFIHHLALGHNGFIDQSQRTELWMVPLGNLVICAIPVLAIDFGSRRTFLGIGSAMLVIACIGLMVQGLVVPRSASGGFATGGSSSSSGGDDGGGGGSGGGKGGGQFGSAAVAAAIAESQEASVGVLASFGVAALVAYGVSWGGMKWVMVNELFGVRYRARGVGFCIFVHWFTVGVLTVISTYAVDKCGSSPNLFPNASGHLTPAAKNRFDCLAEPLDGGDS